MIYWVKDAWILKQRNKAIHWQNFIAMLHFLQEIAYETGSKIILSDTNRCKKDRLTYN